MSQRCVPRNRASCCRYGEVAGFSAREEGEKSADSEGAPSGRSRPEGAATFNAALRPLHADVVRAAPGRTGQVARAPSPIRYQGRLERKRDLRGVGKLAREIQVAGRDAGSFRGALDPRRGDGGRPDRVDRRRSGARLTLYGVREACSQNQRRGPQMDAHHLSFT